MGDERMCSDLLSVLSCHTCVNSRDKTGQSIHGLRLQRKVLIYGPLITESPGVLGRFP